MDNKCEICGEYGTESYIFNYEVVLCIKHYNEWWEYACTNFKSQLVRVEEVKALNGLDELFDLSFYLFKEAKKWVIYMNKESEMH